MTAGEKREGGPFPRIDLHMHSNASDGSDTPRELVDKVLQAGIGMFSLTDHDTVAGIAEVRSALDQRASEMGAALLPVFIPGVEFSCIGEQGKCHILGYGMDPEHPAMKEALAEGRRLRRGKFAHRLVWLKEQYGIVFDPPTIERLSANESVGKPHLAEEIIRLGYADTITEAIQTYLSHCDRGIQSRIPAQLAVRSILEAGGIPVWAHPLGGEGEQRLSRAEHRALLEELNGYGIRGLECCYSRYSGEESSFLVSGARSKGLWISGGSDYHGSRKTIALGQLSADGRTDLSVINIFQAPEF